MGGARYGKVHIVTTCMGCERRPRLSAPRHLSVCLSARPFRVAPSRMRIRSPVLRWETCSRFQRKSLETSCPSIDGLTRLNA